jgi:hypothetical protein
LSRIKNGVFFSQLPAVKKDTIFGVAQTKVGPSYFVSFRNLCVKHIGYSTQKIPKYDKNAFGLLVQDV